MKTVSKGATTASFKCINHLRFSEIKKLILSKNQFIYTVQYIGMFEECKRMKDAVKLGGIVITDKCQRTKVDKTIQYKMKTFKFFRLKYQFTLYLCMNAMVLMFANCFNTQLINILILCSAWKSSINFYFTKSREFCLEKAGTFCCCVLVALRKVSAAHR